MGWRIIAQEEDWERDKKGVYSINTRRSRTMIYEATGDDATEEALLENVADLGDEYKGLKLIRQRIRFRRQPAEQGGRLVASVELFYDDPSRVAVSSRGGSITLHMLGPPAVEWHSETIRVPMIEDVRGRRICNTVGDPFDPPPEADRSIVICRVSAAVTAFPPGAMQLVNTINSENFSIDGGYIPARQGFMRSMGLSHWHYDAITYRVLQYEIAVKPIHLGDWKLRLLNVGVFCRDQNGARIRATIGGLPVSSPVPLDANGRVIENPTPDNVVTLAFDIYPEADWSGLPR